MTIMSRERIIEMKKALGFFVLLGMSSVASAKSVTYECVSSIKNDENSSFQYTLKVPVEIVPGSGIEIVSEPLVSVSLTGEQINTVQFLNDSPTEVLGLPNSSNFKINVPDSVYGLEFEFAVRPSSGVAQVQVFHTLRENTLPKRSTIERCAEARS